LDANKRKISQKEEKECLFFLVEKEKEKERESMIE